MRRNRAARPESGASLAASCAAPAASLPLPRPAIAGASADVRVKRTTETKVTSSTGKGALPKGWPKDEDEWRRLARAVLPWVAGAAIAVAAAAAYQKAQVRLIAAL
jgi:hypothetical protein